MSTLINVLPYLLTHYFVYKFFLFSPALSYMYAGFLSILAAWNSIKVPNKIKDPEHVHHAHAKHSYREEDTAHMARTCPPRVLECRIEEKIIRLQPA